MKTPLPEKIQTESGTQWVESSLPYKINQLIDYLAELTEVVEGLTVQKIAKEQLDQNREMIERIPLEDKNTLKETLEDELCDLPLHYSRDGQSLVALSEVRAIINRLMP